MKVKKRDGRLEEVNLDKITKSIQHACEGLEGAEPYQIAIKTVGGSPEIIQRLRRHDPPQLHVRLHGQAEGRV